MSSVYRPTAELRKASHKCAKADSSSTVVDKYVNITHEIQYVVSIISS